MSRVGLLGVLLVALRPVLVGTRLLDVFGEGAGARRLRNEFLSSELARRVNGIAHIIKDYLGGSKKRELLTSCPNFTSCWYCCAEA